MASKKKTKKKTGKKAAGPIVLAKRATIGKIEELQEQLSAALDQKSDVEIDASNVEAVDTASLQLLVAFVNSRWKQEKSVVWKEPSDEFISRTGLTGLTEVLGIQSAGAVNDAGA